MSLFRGLNEAPTTKGGPACSRTACPPAPDAHNSFIQEPHVHTKAPEINPTSRHPGQCPESSQNPRLKRGDSIQGRSNRRPATKSQHEKKHFFFFFFLLKRRLGRGRRPLHAPCAVLVPGSHSPATLGQRRRLSDRGASAAARAECAALASQAPVPLGLGALCSNGLCEPQPLAFPTGSRVYSRVHTHENAPPEAVA